MYIVLVFVMSKHSVYYDKNIVQQALDNNHHREAIGGLWEEMGELQISFLRKMGLLPEHKLLDIGCGALRLGVKAVDYLHSGNYFGMDLCPELINAGYEKELTPAQRNKLPRQNLIACDNFDFTFLQEPVDMAIAQSVFTHLPFNHIRHCLCKLTDWIKPDGVFCATAWIIPDEHPIVEPYTHNNNCRNQQPITTSDIEDSYHYKFADFVYAAADTNWDVQLFGNWNHPRGQQMLIFTRI